MGLFLFYILFALLFSSTPGVVVHSRTHPKTTTLLDVAASTRKTTSVFASDSKPTTTTTEKLSFSERESETTSKLSLTLHPRASVHGPSHSDYRSLTLSRLARDSARVRSLSTRLDLALGKISPSDLDPVVVGSDSEFGSEAVQAPVVSGTSQGSGEYFSRVGIGSPPSQAYVVLDTGSDVSWVQCAPCAECYSQTDPIFDPTNSLSYSPLGCDSPQCKSLDLSECRNDTCLYEVSYGDGSYTVGEFVTETLTLGSASISGVALGCGHSNEGLFVGAAGLLGLGGGTLSFSSQIHAASFSYCLVDRDSDSASTLDFDSPLKPSAVTAPLRRNPEFDTFYYLGLDGLSVGGQALTVPRTAFELDGNGNGGIIVDSGTAVTRLQTDVYDALRDAFVSGTRHLQSVDGGVALFDTCYDLSSKASVEVPTVSFIFAGGKELPLPAENFLIPIDSNGTYCFAFAPTTSSLSIIGNVQQQGTRVGFDLAKSLVGFMPHDC